MERKQEETANNNDPEIIKAEASMVLEYHPGIVSILELIEPADIHKLSVSINKDFSGKSVAKTYTPGSFSVCL